MREMEFKMEREGTVEEIEENERGFYVKVLFEE